MKEIMKPLELEQKLKLKKSFDDVFADLSVDLELVKSAISKGAGLGCKEIVDISSYLINLGGKRIRPMLLILSSQVSSKESLTTSSKEKVINLAAAVELIHSATLLHDDVVDESSMRRGKATSNSIWGNKLSILVGDYLFSLAFRLMVSSDNIDILGLLSQTSSIMANGEVMQLTSLYSEIKDVDQDTYNQIIIAKTASIFAAACKSGAMVVNTDKNAQESLYKFGENLGIAFQIADDILDYISSDNALGKNQGDDFFEGKITLPAIIAYKNANASEKKFIEEVFARNRLEKPTHGDLQKFIEIMRKNDCLEICKNEAVKYRNLATQNLSNFSDSSEKSAMLTLLDYSVLGRI